MGTDFWPPLYILRVSGGPRPDENIVPEDSGIF